MLTPNISNTHFNCFSYFHSSALNFKSLFEKVHFLRKLAVLSFSGSFVRWKIHIDCICSEVSKSIGVFSKINILAPHQIVLTRYHTLVYPPLHVQHLVQLNGSFILHKKMVGLIDGTSHSQII